MPYQDCNNGRTVKQFMCLLMSTIGLLLIIDISGVSREETDLRGVFFGLSASFFYALLIVLNRCIKKIGGIHRTFLQFIVAIICLIPYVMINGGMHLEQLDTKGWISMLIIGFLHTGVGYCLYFSALKNISGQKVAI